MNFSKYKINTMSPQRIRYDMCCGLLFFVIT